MANAQGKIMDAEFEELVADSMQARAAAVRITADLPSLARRARRRHRQRQHLVRSGLTAGIAAAVAVAVVLATGAGPQRAAPGPLRAETLAYVMSRTESSLAGSASREIAIEYDSWHGPDFATGFADELGAVTPGAQSSHNWSYGRWSRTEMFAADGRPLSGEAVVLPAGRRNGSRTEVDYRARTWWHAVISSGLVFVILPPPASCQWAPFPPPTTAWIRHVLRCGLFRVAGRQKVHGVDAIEIVSRRLMVPGTREVIWIDPDTYLPVQSYLATTTGPRQWVEAQYAWVPATRRNLTMLTEPIPAGFRRVSQPSLAVIAPGTVLRSAPTPQAARKAATSRPTP